MKRLLLIISVILIALSVEGQMIIKANANHRARVVTAAPAAEMITNGSFTGITQAVSTDGSQWVTGARWTIHDGAAYFDDLGTSAVYQHPLKMAINVAGSTDYTLKFDIVSAGNAYIRFLSRTGQIYINLTNYTTGSHSLNFTSPADVGEGGLDIYTTTTGDAFSITNISLKER